MIGSQRVKSKVQSQPYKQQKYKTHRKVVVFVEGQAVWARNFRGEYPWKRAVVLKSLGSSLYLVEPYPGVKWKRHTDQLRVADKEVETDRDRTVAAEAPVFNPFSPPLQEPSTDVQQKVTAGQAVNESRTVDNPETSTPDGVAQNAAGTPAPAIRCSTRVRKPPDRLNL